MNSSELSAAATASVEAVPASVEAVVACEPQAVRLIAIVAAVITAASNFEKVRFFIISSINKNEIISFFILKAMFNRLNIAQNE